MREVNGLTSGERMLVDLIKKETGRECFVCSICGEVFFGFGNNAYPVAKGDCCNECNNTKVIPMRIAQMCERS